MNADKRRGET